MLQAFVGSSGKPVFLICLVGIFKRRYNREAGSVYFEELDFFHDVEDYIILNRRENCKEKIVDLWLLYGLGGL